MSTTTILIIGGLAFATYLFFLLRMVWKQHHVQEENPNQNPDRDQPKLWVDRGEESRKAS